MKTFFDFFPVLAFFVVYIFFGRDIYLATKVIMVAMLVQILLLWLWHRSVSRMHLISAALVLAFGGATLMLQNDLFIKWKPTVANWLFAAFFMGSQLFTEKPIIQRMLQASVELDAPSWRMLNVITSVFFFVLGVLNLFVVYNFSEATWVKFKLFGLIGLTFAFFLGMGAWIATKAAPQEDA